MGRAPHVATPEHTAPVGGGQGSVWVLYRPGGSPAGGRVPEHRCVDHPAATGGYCVWILDVVSRAGWPVPTQRGVVAGCLTRRAIEHLVCITFVCVSSLTLDEHHSHMPIVLDRRLSACYIGDGVTDHGIGSGGDMPMVRSVCLHVCLWWHKPHRPVLVRGLWPFWPTRCVRILLAE